MDENTVLNHYSHFIEYSLHDAILYSDILFIVYYVYNDILHWKVSTFSKIVRFSFGHFIDKLIITHSSVKRGANKHFLEHVYFLIT